MSSDHDNETKASRQAVLLSIRVEIRTLRNSSSSRVKAHADVELIFESLGSVQINGFSIYEPEGKALVLLPPAQKGERRSFPHVKLVGKIRTQVESAVLREYENTAEDAA